VNRYLQKSVGEEIERKHKVLHVLTNEIRSRVFLPRSFNICLIPFVLKKSVHPSAQNQDLFNGDIARCPRCRKLCAKTVLRSDLLVLVCPSVTVTCDEHNPTSRFPVSAFGFGSLELAAFNGVRLGGFHHRIFGECRATDPALCNSMALVENRYGVLGISWIGCTEQCHRPNIAYFVH